MTLALAPTFVSARVVWGANLRALRDRGRAAERCPRFDPHVGSELDVGVDPGRLRVDDGHPGEHVALVDELARLALGDKRGRRGELMPRVDVGVARTVGGDAEAGGAHRRQDVTEEVLLALGVVFC